MNQLRPDRVEEPQEAAAEFAEVALRLATILGSRGVDGELFLTLNFQCVRVSAEVYDVTTATRRLAADGAVARLIWVRRLRLHPEVYRSTVTRTFQQHGVLP